MEPNDNMAKIYELLEQFDFSELSEQDKNYVLANISEQEYAEMRSTIKATQGYFTHAETPEMGTSFHETIGYEKGSTNKIMKFLTYPLQLYKVAALIALVISLYFLFRTLPTGENEKLLAINDTVYIHKTDTVFSERIDTVKIIQQKIVQVVLKPEITKSSQIVTNAKFEYDCRREICPSNVDQLTNLAFANNVKSDTLLNDFVVDL